MNPFHKLSIFAILALTLSAGSACTSAPPPADDDDSVDDDDSATDDDDSADDDDDDSTGDDDDSAVSNVQAPPAPEDFEALALYARQDLLQSYTVDVNALGYINGEQGTVLSFLGPDSLSHQDGTPVTGDVTVSLLEVFDKGTMLVANMPSTGLTETGEIAQLISGGEHFVNATQGGEQLVLNTGFILTAPVDQSVGDIEHMTMFRAVTEDGLDADFDDEAVWVEEEVGGDEFMINQTDDDPTGNGGLQYWSLSSQFGWSNIDRWYSDPRPKTTIHVDVPEGFDDTNCAVYLSYDNEPTALANFDTYDASTELFSEHYGLIPIGLEVHVILVTEFEGQWSYAIQAETIVDGQLTTFPSAAALIETDMEGLSAVINGLP